MWKNLSFVCHLRFKLIVSKKKEMERLGALELLEERMRIENMQDRMALDVNNELPFVRQGSGRRPGPCKFCFFPIITNCSSPPLLFPLGEF